MTRDEFEELELRVAQIEHRLRLLESRVRLLERLGSAEAGWVIGRSFVPRIAVLLAPAAGYGVERIPLEGGAVVAANHFSGIDHPLIGAFSPRMIYFLAKAELLEIPVVGHALRWLGVFGVRRGEGDREALRTARAARARRGTSSPCTWRERGSASAIQARCSPAG